VSEVEEKKALVRRFLEARVVGDVEAVGKMLAPDFVNHTKVLPDEGPGREGFMRAVARYNSAFSTSSVLVEDQVASGEKVVIRCVVRRTHDRGKVMGVAPSGRELTYMLVVIHRIEGGKIAEQWGGGTGLSELRGLGLEQAERERVEQELLVARRIQQATLPKEVPQLEGWQIFPLYQPAREVGGDFYDFHLLSEGRLGLAVGGRHRQGGARSACDDHHLRHVAARRSSLGLLLAWRGISPSQRGVVGPHPTQHVRDLLLRHSRSREG
jgi:predicted ester cyclase